MVKICATTVIFALCMAASIYAWTSPDTDALVNEYGYSTNNFLSGKIYVTFTSIFLHTDVTHLISNLMVLLIFGLTLEGEIGSGKFVALFFGGAFFGDLLSSFVYAPSISAIGASGGVFTIIAATMLIKPVQMEYYVPIPLGVIAIGYLAYAIIGLITNYPPHVAHVAHMGGALVGLIYGCHRQGLKSTFKILLVALLLILLLPIIWNLWVLFFEIMLGATQV